MQCSKKITILEMLVKKKTQNASKDADETVIFECMQNHPK